jgi:hypothetical protein
MRFLRACVHKNVAIRLEAESGAEILDIGVHTAFRAAAVCSVLKYEKEKNTSFFVAILCLPIQCTVHQATMLRQEYR